VAIANALQLKAARATPALSRFNYYAMPSLKSLDLSIEVLVFLLLGSGIILSLTFDDTIYPFLNYSAFVANTLFHAVTLTFDRLTLKVCGTLYIKGHVIKVYEM